MHFALCWHKNRFRLLVYAVVAVALAILATLPVGMTHEQGEWTFERAATPERIAAIWQEGARNLAVVQLVLMLLVAADLGASGLSEDGSRQSLHYMLTRPRRRSYFALASWAAGLSQMASLLAVAALVAVLVLQAPTGTVRLGALSGSLGQIMVVAALVYGISYLGAAATGSARRGYETAGAVVVTYLLVRAAASTITGAQTWFTLQRAMRSSLAAPEFSALTIAAFVLLVVALPWVAAAAFARREV